MILGL